MQEFKGKYDKKILNLEDNIKHKKQAENVPVPL
jgi:hypothetical protein